MLFLKAWYMHFMKLTTLWQWELHTDMLCAALTLLFFPHGLFLDNLEQLLTATQWPGTALNGSSVAFNVCNTCSVACDIGKQLLYGLEQLFNGDSVAWNTC